MTLSFVFFALYVIYVVRNYLTQRAIIRSAHMINLSDLARRCHEVHNLNKP